MCEVQKGWIKNSYIKQKIPWVYLDTRDWFLQFLFLGRFSDRSQTFSSDDQLTKLGYFMTHHGINRRGERNNPQGICFHSLFSTEPKSRASLNGFRLPWKLAVFIGITVQIEWANKTTASVESTAELRQKHSFTVLQHDSFTTYVSEPCGCASFSKFLKYHFKIYHLLYSNIRTYFVERRPFPWSSHESINYESFEAPSGFGLDCSNVFFQLTACEQLHQDALRLIFVSPILTYLFLFIEIEEWKILLINTLIVLSYLVWFILIVPRVLLSRAESGIILGSHSL